MFDSHPIGWIPHEFRKYHMEDLTDEELQNMVGSTGVFREVNGEYQRFDDTLEDLRAKGLKKSVGVTDIRTGEYYPNLSKVPIVHVD